MSSFIYSINATLPIFIIMIVGYILKHNGILNENFVNVSNEFIFKAALPALLVQDIGSAKIMDVLDLHYLLYCMIVTSVSFWGIWGITKFIMKDKSMVGAFVQASFRGSAAVLGIAFVQNIYGTSGMAPLMVIGAVPLYNIYSVIVLTFESENKNMNNIKCAIVNIIKNPIILGIFAGLILSILGVYESFPEIFVKTINNMAIMATPLALITIGCGFEGRKALAKIKPTVVASFIKLIVLPALFLPIALGMGFRDQKIIAILVMLGAPSTVSCYIMAKNMNSDGVLTSSIIVVTTLFSCFTLTLWVYLLKRFSFV